MNVLLINRILHPKIGFRKEASFYEPRITSIAVSQSCSLHAEKLIPSRVLDLGRVNDFANLQNSHQVHIGTLLSVAHEEKVDDLGTKANSHIASSTTHSMCSEYSTLGRIGRALLRTTH